MPTLNLYINQLLLFGPATANPLLNGDFSHAESLVFSPYQFSSNDADERRVPCPTLDCVNVRDVLSLLFRKYNETLPPDYKTWPQLLLKEFRQFALQYPNIRKVALITSEPATSTGEVKRLFVCFLNGCRGLISLELRLFGQLSCFCDQKFCTLLPLIPSLHTLHTLLLFEFPPRSDQIDLSFLSSFAYLRLFKTNLVPRAQVADLLNTIPRNLQCMFQVDFPTNVLILLAFQKLEQENFKAFEVGFLQYEGKERKSSNLCKLPLSEHTTIRSLVNQLLTHWPGQYPLAIPVVDQLFAQVSQYSSRYSQYSSQYNQW